MRRALLNAQKANHVVVRDTPRDSGFRYAEASGGLGGGEIGPVARYRELGSTPPLHREWPGGENELPAQEPEGLQTVR